MRTNHGSSVGSRAGEARAQAYGGDVLIYHIAEPDRWNPDADLYRAESLETEGFIHCSTGAQLRAVAHDFYPERTDVIVLTVDIDRLDDPLIFEDLHGHGEEHPHVYGPIPIRAVVRSEPIGDVLG